MTKALLITPSFWDPICPPLGAASLKSFGEMHGHKVNILDLNTHTKIFGAQKPLHARGGDGLQRRVLSAVRDGVRQHNCDRSIVNLCCADIQLTPAAYSSRQNL